VTVRRRVLLIGGSGVFGRRLATHLGRIAGLDLLLTSRDENKAKQIAAGIAAVPETTIGGIRFDNRRNLDVQLGALAPWLVIDASGPFQDAGYEVPRAALMAGAHVVDLADARDYILGYGAALDALARERGLVALAGASSTPALSAAVVTALTESWQRIDSIDIAITPGGRSEVGRAVIAAILSYAGRPIPVWREGELQQVHGWLDAERVAMPGLGMRRTAAVETVDAQSLGPALRVGSRVSFRAGLESPIEQYAVMALAWLRRAGVVGDARALIPALLSLRRISRLPTSDRGGMLVAVTGLDTAGALRQARWSLLAERGDGPHVPTLPAAAALRALLDGRLAPGARSAAGSLTLAEIEAEMAPYAITTRCEHNAHGEAVFRDALDAASFTALPAPLAALHGAAGPPVWQGRASVETGTHPLARLARRVIGLPPAGHDVPITFSIDRIADRGGKAEVWTRNFSGRRFSSQLSANALGELQERFGPIRFTLGLAARDGGLALPITSARCFGIPLPRFVLPRSEAREYVDDIGRFRFDIRLSLPGIGLLTHYRGWLEPRSRE
jgi:hypothetical protein